MEDCLAIDFNNVKAECWIHTDERRYNVIFPNEDVDHFEKQECEDVTPTPPPGTGPPCRVEFQKREGTFSYGGLEREDERTLDECMDECRDVSAILL